MVPIPNFGARRIRYQIYRKRFGDGSDDTCVVAESRHAGTFAYYGSIITYAHRRLLGYPVQPFGMYTIIRSSLEPKAYMLGYEVLGKASRGMVRYLGEQRIDLKELALALGVTPCLASRWS